MLDIWQTFGCVLVHHLGLPKEEFPLYNASLERRGERLYRQLLHDGYGYRLANKEAGATIHTFPFRRPEKNRIAQVLFTLVRIPYDTFRWAKIFPQSGNTAVLRQTPLGLPKGTERDCLTSIGSLLFWWETTRLASSRAIFL